MLPIQQPLAPPPPGATAHLKCRESELIGAGGLIYTLGSEALLGKKMQTISVLIFYIDSMLQW